MPIAGDPHILAWPGGPVLETDEGAWGLGTASFDASRRWRYRLSRVWDPDGARLAVVMLNPSTADAAVLDPTVRRCVGYARAWGFGALEVVNLFAWRSTDPRALARVADPVGPENDGAILAAAWCAELVVAAWGVHGRLGGRGRRVARTLAAAGVELAALATTGAGEPRHPLYLAGSLLPRPWTVPEESAGE